MLVELFKIISVCGEVFLYGIVYPRSLNSINIMLHLAGNCDK